MEEAQHKHDASNKDTTNGIAQHVYETSHIINCEKADLSTPTNTNETEKLKKLYISMLLLLEMAIPDAS